MARTEISANDLAVNAGSLQTVTIMPAGATGSDGYTIKDVERDTDVVISITNTGATTGKFKILAGDSVNALQGDLEVELTAGQKRSFKLDGARFRKAGGKYDVDAGVTGALHVTQ